MSARIRMHFDGRCFIPEEPVDFPMFEALEAVITVVKKHSIRSPEMDAAWKQCLALRKTLPVLSDEAMRRDNLYESCL